MPIGGVLRQVTAACPDRRVPRAAIVRCPSSPPIEELVPHIRSFRALRYRGETVPDLSLVVSPPYDVISPEDQRVLLERDPRNVVRLDLPEVEEGDGPDDRYRRAARALAAWRSDGTLQKDPRPAIYVYEQTYRVPGGTDERRQRGFFARLRLESYGEGGVLPHERTMEAPREDRFRLLKATGVNTSPVVGLFEDPGAVAAVILAGIAEGAPEADITDADGVRHRLWVVVDDGSPDGTAAQLTVLAGSGPVTIADGHHRYETALRYRDERRMSRSCEEDPAFDYLLMLLLSTSEPLTILPTHRVVRHLADESGLLERATALFEVKAASPGELAAAFDGASGTGGRGRFGLWTRSGGAILDARPEALEAATGDGGEAVRRLDVTVLGSELERLCDIDAAAVATGDRLSYTKSAVEAMDLVDGCKDGADAAFLLEPTPVQSVIEVAAQGDVMPQKSTYFYPKALTGLVINPHEW
jgi:uncharacterized protein (DUF1015 family)